MITGSGWGGADEAGRTALLWDLDNVAPPRPHLASLARALCCLVAPDAPLLAAGHRMVFRSCRTLLADLGFEVHSGGRRKSGADRVLLREAKALARRGVDRFLVASNDHRFAHVATFADLYVVSLTDEYVSLRLRAAARSVSVMSLDVRGWQRWTSGAQPEAVFDSLPSRSDQERWRVSRRRP